MSLPRGWKTKILKGIGAPVTQNNLALLRAWQQAEGGGTANDANFNPLNTTQEARGASSINSVGVKSYRNASQGIRATVQTLLNGRYGPIIDSLKADAHPAVTARAIAQTPWGTAEGVLRVLGAGGGAAAPEPAAPRASRASRPEAPGFKLKAAAPYNPVPTLTSNLGKIASGWDPTETLGETSQGMLEGLLRPSTLSLARPQVGAPSPQGRGASLAAPGPGGKWGGAYRPATQLAKVGEGFGLTPTSEKRDRKMTSSGGVSDHWTGSTNSYAYDLGGAVEKMDRAAKAIAARLGIPYKQGQPLVATKTTNGLRYQVLYRTNVGGNHFNHIHIGVKRV